MDDNKITYFASTDTRGKKVSFGIKAKDRTRHVYVIGKTGMGKSTLLENMAVQDIQNGEGLCFIDPHGKTAELLLEYVPENRIDDVVYFAPFDLENPISFNVMEDVGPDKRHLVVSGLMSAFKKFFGEESFSDRMQYILQNTILALLEYPGSTMLGINRMLTDKDYREKVVANVTDEAVKTYWTQEFAKYTEKFAAEATPAIQNKIGQFTSNPLIRNIIGQPKSSFDIRRLMDEKKIFIVNLSKGRVGESNAALLGSMLVTKIYLAAMSRADVPDKVLKTLPNFYLFVDEFQSFANDSFADILSEARKYKLNLTIAHQYVEQMPEEVRAAVFGNVGTMIVFRVGAFDAEIFEKEFAPQFTAEDIVNLGFAQIYLKLMIDGIGSQPFSANTLGPIKEPSISFRKEIIESSRRQFAKPRPSVEDDIAVWMRPVEPAPKGKRLTENKPAPGTRDTGSQKLGEYLKDVMAGAPAKGTKAEKEPKPEPAPVPEVAAVKEPAALKQAIAPVLKKEEAREEMPAAKVATPAEPKHREAKPALAVAAAMAPKKEERHPKHFTRSDYIKNDVRKPAPVGEEKASHHTPSSAHASLKPDVVPLSTLGAHKTVNDQKQATAKNMNDLRAALAAVMGAPKKEEKKAAATAFAADTPKAHLNHDPHKHLVHGHKPEEGVHAKEKTHHDAETRVKNQKGGEVPNPMPASSQKEVPEDVLRTILKSE